MADPVEIDLNRVKMFYPELCEVLDRPEVAEQVRRDGWVAVERLRRAMYPVS